jgi:hypothetical protein
MNSSWTVHAWLCWFLRLSRSLHLRICSELDPSASWRMHGLLFMMREWHVSRTSSDDLTRNERDTGQKKKTKDEWKIRPCCQCTWSLNRTVLHLLLAGRDAKKGKGGGPALGINKQASFLVGTGLAIFHARYLCSPRILGDRCSCLTPSEIDPSATVPQKSYSLTTLCCNTQVFS